MRVLPSKSYAPHATFGGIVINAETAIVEIRPQPFKAGQAIADCASQGRLARDLCELRMEPRFKIIDERCRPFLPDGSAPVRWIASDGSFDLVQRRDAFQCFFRNTRALGNMDVKELAADMSETGNFLDAAAPIKLFKTGITVSM